MSLQIEAYIAKDAKERMLVGKPNPEANLPQGSRAPQSRDIAAAVTGASPRNVQEAKKLAKEAPALLEKVKTGELSRRFSAPLQPDVVCARAGYSRLIPSVVNQYCRCHRACAC